MASFGETAATAISDPLKAIGDLFGKLGEGIKNTLLPPLENTLRAFEAIGTALKTIFPILDVAQTQLKKFGEAFKNAFRENIGLRIAAVLGGVKDALLSIIPTSVIEYVKNSGGKVGEAIGATGKAFGSIVGAAGVAVLAILAIATALAGMVQKANPAVYDQLQLAMNDLMAVIGQALVPIFQNVVIPVIRMVGDTLMGLAPIGGAIATVLKPLVAVLGVVFEVVGKILSVIGGVLEQLAPSLNALGEAFLAIVQAVEPVISLVIDLISGALSVAVGALAKVLEAVIPYIVAIARVVGDVVKTVVGWVRQLLSFIGIDLPEVAGTKPGSSVGAAARSAQHMDPMEALKQAQRSAYSLGTASGTDPAKATSDAAKKISDRADQIYKFIQELPQKMWDFIKQLPEMIARAIKGLARSVVEGAGEAIGKAESFYDRHAPDIFPETNIKDRLGIKSWKPWGSRKE